jgi:hypothetical protein
MMLYPGKLLGRLLCAMVGLAVLSSCTWMNTQQKEEFGEITPKAGEHPAGQKEGGGQAIRQQKEEFGEITPKAGEMEGGGQVIQEQKQKADEIK